MTSAVIANAIVNGCGVIGLVVAMLALHRRDARSPLTGRFLIALGIVALLFLVRSAAWLTGSSLLDDLSVIPAAAIPFGALIVTEGMLRRHAPRAIKLAVIVGAVVLGLGGALGLERFDTPYAIALALFQLAGFAACAFLLATRDRHSLMASENRAVDRMTIGAVVVLPFIVTDFGALMPDMPVKLGALGALLVVTAMLIAGSSGEARWHAVLLTVLRLVSSTLLGLAAAFVAPDVDAAQVMRFCAIAVSGVLAIGLMTDTLRSFLESRAPGVLSSVAISPATTRDQLIAELLRHPLFESARRYREDELAAYDPLLLRNRLASHRVLRRADAPWGHLPIDPAAERLASLMAAVSATHLVVLSSDPVDILALAVPVTSADPATETAIALVQRILIMTA
ncbi:hypothetical protein ACFQZO_22395 [Bradyrhizobium sp. GCM10027634]|uniref:hypothetical protein n=1 Tax=unclassified Bradyrhizobium TaxID=2631580 RepID=UPI00188A24EE|nr:MULTISPECIES: hypothetical protein [unclassified Bradyrhizobium]MDN5003587.1 hypothetical protein [Bradyrhizobium sp. WYCCWR 12677]QOZ47868.1 hypothetical protein XH89_33565 [Bradyrhizobium sp. CCBAU 53340]